MQTDGKILMAGLYSYNEGAPTVYFDFMLAKYKSDGLIDSSFGEMGVIKSEYQHHDFEGWATKVIELPDKKILVGGVIYKRVSTEDYNWPFPFYLGAAKYNSDGSEDTSFGVYGLAKVDFGENFNVFNPQMAIQPDGKILLSGTLRSPDYPITYSDIIMARLNPDGLLDSSFGENGITITDIDKSLDAVSSILLLENNKIIATANFAHDSYIIRESLDSIAVLRFNSNGTVDSGFGKKGKTILSYQNKPGSNSTCSILLPSGKIVIGGYSYNDSSFLLVAINKNGTIDSSFGNNGFTITSFTEGDGSGNNNTKYNEQAFAYDMDLTPDGKIILVGTKKYKQYSRYNNYSEMVIARYFGESVLPITLSSFTATKKQNSVVLNWQTTNETNNSYFSLERSNNNNDGFKEIARVNSKGNSSQTQQYSYEDLVPLNGNNYYRLKQVDKNGSVTTSKIVSVDFSNNKIKIYPNPASSFLTIEGLMQGAKTNLTILNANGVAVAKASTENSNYSFNIRSLPAGTYFIKIRNEDIELVKQFIKR